MLSIPLLHFSCSAKLPPRFYKARKKGESILLPVQTDDFTVLKATKGTDGRPLGKHLKLIGLKPDPFKRFMSRFFEKHGVVAIEGLSRLFPNPIDFRRVVLGIGHQLRDEPAFQLSLHAPKKIATNPLQLRVVADPSRTTASVDHIVHPHADLGINDYGQELDTAPYAVGIADKVERGGKTARLLSEYGYNSGGLERVDGKSGSVLRVLAAVEDYTKQGWITSNISNNPAGMLRPVLQGEVEHLGHILLPHTGCLYIGSNVSTNRLKRWGHYSIPTFAYDYASSKNRSNIVVERFSRDDEKMIELALNGGFGWKMPYMLLQFNRPSASTFDSRTTHPAVLQQIIKTGQS